MNIRSNPLLICILLAVLYFILDGIIDYLLFYRELGFFGVLFIDPPINELYNRLLGVAFLVVLGLLWPVLGYYHKDRESDGKPAESTLSADPSLMVNVSNQIRTPLNAIMGFIELLRDPQLSSTSKSLYLGHIRTSGRYLLELINNITDITKMETGELYLKQDDCRVNRMLDMLHGRYDKLIKEKGKKDLGILLKTSIKDEEFTLTTDEERLKQVLSNLLENSLSFTDQGTIEFGYNLPGKDVIEFYVKDTGTGFSMERLEMMLKQFSKVMDARMRPFDLAALRITISKRIIRLMGGDLTADSRLGHGSDFRFRMPLKTAYSREEAKEEKAVRAAGSEKEPDWSSRRILIAEDVESNFIYLKEILRPTGVQIHWAENGKEAVRQCRSDTQYDAVLMDILMPEMDGYEATKEIKKIHPDLPVIAQTAYSLDRDDYQDANKYFNKFLIKPIWSHDLINCLGGFLNQ